MQIVATLSILVAIFFTMLHGVSAQEAVATFLRSHAADTVEASTPLGGEMGQDWYQTHRTIAFKEVATDGDRVDVSILTLADDDVHAKADSAPHAAAADGLLTPEGGGVLADGLLAHREALPLALRVEGSVATEGLLQNYYYDNYDTSGEACAPVPATECAAAGNQLTGWSKTQVDVVGNWNWVPCGCYIWRANKIQFNIHACNSIVLNDRGIAHSEAICKGKSVVTHYHYGTSGETCAPVPHTECAVAGNQLRDWSKALDEVVVGNWSWVPCGCYIWRGKIQFNTRGCDSIVLSNYGRANSQAICKSVV